MEFDRAYAYVYASKMNPSLAFGGSGSHERRLEGRHRKRQDHQVEGVAAYGRFDFYAHQTMNLGTYLQRLSERSVQLNLSVIEFSREMSRVRVGFPPGFDAIPKAFARKVFAQAVFIHFAVPGEFRLLLFRFFGRHLGGAVC